MKQRPKPKRETDKNYLAYIRKQPCLVWNCPNKAAAHHDPTVAAGGSDYMALPLCSEKHHTTGVHATGKDTFQREYNINFDKERIRLLVGYINILKAKR